MKTYTVVKGDTLWQISRRYLGTGSRYMEIFNMNPQIRSHNPNLIYPGEVLIIPESTEKKEQKVTAKNIDDITIFIKDKQILTPSNFTLEVFFDTCADKYTISNFPFEYNDSEYKEIFKPYSLLPVKIYFGSELYFTGKQEVLSFDDSPSATSVTSAGRTNTYLLIKSNMPTSAYPLQKCGLTLKQILTDWVLPVFSLQLQADADTGASFSNISIGETEEVWRFLSELAAQRYVVLSNTADGKLRIHKPDLTQTPTIIIKDKTVGYDNSNITYDSNERHGTYIGLSQSNTYGKFKAVIQDKLFIEQSWKVVNPTDSTKNINAATQWEAAKAIRDALTLTITMPSWINPATKKIWHCGELISLLQPSIMINQNFTFLIRSILYKNESDKKSCELRLVPPQCYTGEALITEPWS